MCRLTGLTWFSGLDKTGTESWIAWNRPLATFGRFQVLNTGSKSVMCPFPRAGGDASGASTTARCKSRPDQFLRHHSSRLEWR